MLAGTDTYDDVEAELERYRGHFDQPLQNVGTVWRVASPLDAWLNLARHLSDRDLDRFEQAAHAVFGAEDPRYALPAHERWMAPVLGVAPPQSGWLRKGIGHTLILLAVRGRAASVRDAGRRADAIVNQLLDGATSPRWWSLARDLQLLAEASPAAFLSAIEDSLDRDEPPIGVLFGADPGGLSGTEYLSNLLWALETLAWSPEWLGARELGAGAPRSHRSSAFESAPQSTRRGAELDLLALAPADLRASRSATAGPRCASRPRKRRLMEALAWDPADRARARDTDRPPPVARRGPTSGSDRACHEPAGTAKRHRDHPSSGRRCGNKRRAMARPPRAVG
jgi:hypothetical protein